MPYQLSALQELFGDICGPANVIMNYKDLYPYGQDQTLNWHFDFDMLIRPGSVQEVSAILKVCDQYRIPITPRGGGSGVTGGALPFKGGIVLSMERLNKILSVNQEECYAIAEAGVITSDLCNLVEEAGLYLPSVPGSKAFSFVGGNVAENAGGIRSCKYGTTARSVLNLEVVLPAGEIIWTGANVAKNATGFNLTQLFAGSEGTLGVITKVVYRLIPKPAHELSVLAEFESLEDACKAIIAIRRCQALPSGVELICRSALELTMAYLDGPGTRINEHIRPQLLIEIQERHPLILDISLQEILSILREFTRLKPVIGVSEKEIETLNKVRLSTGKAMKAFGKTYRDIDACIPVGYLNDYIIMVEAICKAHGIHVVIFGHALDGNLHTMLMTDDTPTGIHNLALKKATDEIYHYALSVGGVISGEHGIGLLQKEYMPLQFPENHLGLMKNIKRLFDPHNILNPGKIFDLD